MRAPDDERHCGGRRTEPVHPQVQPHGRQRGAGRPGTQGDRRMTERTLSAGRAANVRQPRCYGPLADRLWPKVRLTPDCWIWLGSVNNAGYGRIAPEPPARGWVLVHRAVWVLKFGPIPIGLQVLHHCDNRRCANWSHLFLGTNADNVADRQAKGRHRWGVRFRPTAQGPEHPGVTR